MTTRPHDPAALQAKFTKARDEINAALIERHDETDLVLTALVCQENPLLVGPPGTAKSLLLDSLMHWLDCPDKQFTVLFNKFTTPEEVFGPLSIAGLKQDRFLRVTAGKLPEAVGAFGDEIFKASSAILNTLLRILNERVYDDGTGRLRKVPLKIFVAASNEWPSEDGGKELNALFDRFLLRKRVRPISTAAGIDKLLWGTDLSPKFSQKLTVSEVDQATEEARKLPFSGAAKNGVYDTINELKKEGIRPGDRRLRKSVAACRAYAWINGASQVEPDHLEVLAHTLWDDPVEQPEKTAQIVGKIANPQKMQLNALLGEAGEILGKLNPGNLAEVSTAMSKLGVILKNIQAVNVNHPSQFGTNAETYLKEQIKEIKLQSLNNLG